MTFLERVRTEVEELSAQRRVPVLVDGGHVIHESQRIVAYLDRQERSA